MELEFLENERNSGEDSGSDRSGSIGSASGSERNGSANGSGGSDNRSGGSDNGSGGSAGTTASADDFGGIGNSESSSGNNGSDRSENRSANGDRRTRVERERERRTIRLGDFGNRNTDTASAGSDTGSADEIVDTSGVIRLGNIGRGRKPKEKVNTSEQSAGTFKVSDVKDYINVFLTSIFEIPAIALKQDFWRLEKEEAKQLTSAICDYLDSLPKSDSSKIAAFIQRHFPLINLAMVAFYIVSDRVRQSVAIAQVTKYGNAFSEAVKTGNVSQPKSANDIKTPLDNIVH